MRATIRTRNKTACSLATKTNNPGPVTVSATGPQPDRKDGACFKWTEVK